MLTYYHPFFITLYSFERERKQTFVFLWFCLFFCFQCSSTQCQDPVLLIYSLRSYGKKAKEDLPLQGIICAFQALSSDFAQSAVIIRMNISFLWNVFIFLVSIFLYTSMSDSGSASFLSKVCQGSYEC